MQGRRSNRRLMLVAAAAGLLLAAGCNRDDQVAFDGFYFRASSAPVDKKVTLKEFTVAVRDVEQSLAGAIEAGRFEATGYCIRNFGTSRIEWISGPPAPGEDVSPGDVRIEDGVLIFHGLCDPR